MTKTIPDLWPSDVKVDVLPPIAILEVQEGSLARRTQGMLQAKLTTTETETLVQHQLDLIAPSLNFYRERLLAATHDRIMVHPVTVTASSFAPKPDNGKGLGGHTRSAIDSIRQHLICLGWDQRKAATDEGFLQLIRDVLHSEEVRALSYPAGLKPGFRCATWDDRRKKTTIVHCEPEEGTEVTRWSPFSPRSAPLF
jgi:hypothetical protein